MKSLLRIFIQAVKLAFAKANVSNCMRKMLCVVAKTSNVGGGFLLAVMRI